MAITTTNLLERDGLRVDRFAVPNPLGVVFTFPPMGWKMLEGPGFGGGFITKNGYDCVSFKIMADLWYQDVTLGEIGEVARLSAFAPDGAPYNIRISYGHSMGGYAALLFGPPLGVDRVVALSPFFDLDRPGDHRWRDKIDPLPRNHSMPDFGSIEAIAVYDPLVPLDAAHVAALKDHGTGCAWRLVETIGIGHNMANALRDAGVLSQFVMALLANESVDDILLPGRR